MKDPLEAAPLSRLHQFSHFRLYKTYRGAKNELLNLLDAYDIPYRIINRNIARRYSTRRAYIFDMVIDVEIRRSDLLLVNELLSGNAIEKKHVFEGYNKSELLNVIENPYDYKLEYYIEARTLLEKRGTRFTDDEIRKFKEQKLKALSGANDAPDIWLEIFFSIVFTAGIGCIALGLVLLRIKKDLPDGTSVYFYNTKARGYGAGLIVAGLMEMAAIALWIFL